MLYSKEKTITQVLAEYAGQKDTSRESMKEAYSAIAHNFHSFANKNIAYNKLETLKKGRKYVSLGQYKQKGNFEAKNALESKKEQNLDYLLDMKEKLERNIKDIDLKISNNWRDIVRLNVVDKPKTFWFKEYSFVTLENIKREQKNTADFFENVKRFDIDVKTEEKESKEHFNQLLSMKRTKDREYETLKKEDVIVIDKEALKKFLESLNSNIKKVHEKMKELREELKKDLNAIREKIYNHPKTIEERKERNRQEILERIEREKRTQRQKRNRGENREFER